MFYIGNFWRDDKGDFDKKAPVSESLQLNPYVASYLTISLVIISMFPLVFYQLQSRTIDTLHTAGTIPKIDHFGSWLRQSINTSIWNPIFHHPDLTLSDINQLRVTYNWTLAIFIHKETVVKQFPAIID
jgi:hypothetical protein